MGAARRVPLSDEMAVEPEGRDQRLGRPAHRPQLRFGRRVGARAERASAATAGDRSHRKRLPARRRRRGAAARPADRARHPPRSEEHTSELQSLMRISYAVFCLKKKNINSNHNCPTLIPSPPRQTTTNYTYRIQNT